MNEQPVDASAGAADIDKWPEGMKIVNGQLARNIREQGMIQPPNSYGYVHLAGEVERPRLFKANTAAKKKLLADLKTAAHKLGAAWPEAVRRADVFDAFIIPPGAEEGREVIEKSGYDVHIAAFDVVVLVECTDVTAARTVRDSAEFQAIEERLKTSSSFVHCICARNAKRIAEVDHDRDGVFLFNYFFAADVLAKGAKGVEILLGVWEYTAGWWTAKANLTNSTLLQPLEDEASQYSLINHCRWDHLYQLLPSLIFRPSFKQFVLKNFTANDIVAMPILYHLAH